MEIKIGVRNAAREIVLESNGDANSVASAVESALENGGLLRLADSKGREVMVPVEALAYVETGSPEARRVGFGIG